MADFKIRKITYTISHLHLITFKDHIHKILAPYFNYEPLEYGIDNEGTLNENIRLYHRIEGFIMQFTKEGAVLGYEGPIETIKKSNPIVDRFFDIYEKIREMEGFTKVKSHSLTADSLLTYDRSEHLKTLEQNKYIFNPYGNTVQEFTSVVEYTSGLANCKLQFGNFSKKDIETFGLSSLKTPYNENLYDQYGLLAHFTISEGLKSPSNSKLKALIAESENQINKYF